MMPDMFEAGDLPGCMVSDDYLPRRGSVDGMACHEAEGEIWVGVTLDGDSGSLDSGIVLVNKREISAGEP